MKAVLGIAVAIVACATAWGNEAISPLGLWRTVDDSTGKPTSYVRISEAAGVFTGTVEKFIVPPATSTCELCTDGRKNQPILGMTIMRNVRQTGDDAWGGGDILDPNNGKVYDVRLKLEDGGKLLDVRGYIGVPLLGRTQTWQRVE